MQLQLLSTSLLDSSSADSWSLGMRGSAFNRLYLFTLLLAQIFYLCPPQAFESNKGYLNHHSPGNQQLMSTHYPQLAFYFPLTIFFLSTDILWRRQQILIFETQFFFILRPVNGHISYLSEASDI